jgi:hypothetical protein
VQVIKEADVKSMPLGEFEFLVVVGLDCDLPFFQKKKKKTPLKLALRSLYDGLK